MPTPTRCQQPPNRRQSTLCIIRSALENAHRLFRREPAHTRDISQSADATHRAKPHAKPARSLTAAGGIFLTLLSGQQGPVRWTAMPSNGLGEALDERRS
jgi:hypothetical protein